MRLLKGSGNHMCLENVTYVQLAGTIRCSVLTEINTAARMMYRTA